MGSNDRNALNTLPRKNLVSLSLHSNRTHPTPTPHPAPAPGRGLQGPGEEVEGAHLSSLTGPRCCLWRLLKESHKAGREGSGCERTDLSVTPDENELHI